MGVCKHGGRQVAGPRAFPSERRSRTTLDERWSSEVAFARAYVAPQAIRVVRRSTSVNMVNSLRVMNVKLRKERWENGDIR